MRITSATMDKIGKGLQQGACSTRRWASIASGVVASLLVVANMASAQPIELVSPNEETEGYFGCSVSGIPDMDGDGRADVVVGARQEDPGASPENAGRAYIFSGSGGTLLSTLVSPNEEYDGKFGWSVSGISDVDGDGWGDIVVGAPVVSLSATGAGRAYIFSGSGGTLLSTLVSPNEESNDCFGYSVSGIPDVDGDDREDVAVASGRAYIFSGSDGTLLTTLVSPNEDPGAFSSVSGVLDVDGDGRGDVVVGAWTEGPGTAGRAYIFSGSDGTLLSPLVSPNEELDGSFGARVSGISDVDGDGRGDIVVGAFRENPGASPDGAGRAYIFSGSGGTLLSTLVSPNEDTAGDFGYHVSGIPDVDGDGRGDVIVGAHWENPGTYPQDAGRAYIFSGADGTLLSTLMSPNEEAKGLFGYSVSGISDVDGDGRGDVVVGAHYEDPGSSPEDAGRAYIFPSSSLRVQDWARY